LNCSDFLSLLHILSDYLVLPQLLCHISWPFRTKDWGLGFTHFNGWNGFGCTPNDANNGCKGGHLNGTVLWVNFAMHLGPRAVRHGGETMG
jgi:hypothetical protein